MATTYGSRWTILENTLRFTPTITPKLLIQVESGGYESSPLYIRQRIVVKNTEALSADAPRSYRATRITFSTGQPVYASSNGYDVYGFTTEATNLNTYLDTFSIGDLLILNTNDEPNNNRTTFRDNLVNRFGAQLQYDINWGSRCMYMLIAVCGKGVIYEKIAPRYSASITTTLWLP